MVSIKKEEGLEEAKSDSWMLYWTNHPDIEIKEEEKYDNKSGVKKEILENNTESKSKISHEKNPKDKEILLSKKGSCIKDSKSTKEVLSEIGQSGNGTEPPISNNRKITTKVTKIALTKSLNKDNKKQMGISEKQSFSDKVADLCEFKCPSCGEFFTSKHNISNHFRKTKHVISKNRRIFLRDFMTTIRYYKCLICDQSIICDKRDIGDHLYKNHKISLCKYIGKKNLEYTRKHPKFTEMHQIVYTENEKREISDTIGNYCVFSCLECDFTCQSWSLMGLHKSKNKHGQRAGYNKHTKLATLYKCQICDALILCDKDIIRFHLRTKHKVTLSEYNKKHSPIKGDDSLLAQYLLELKSVVKNIPCAKSYLHGDLLQVFPTTGCTGNISFFKCPDCSKTDMSYKQLLKHCKQEHSERQLIGYANNIEEARYHSCHICSKPIICDNTILIFHLSKAHHMNLSTYSKEYVLKNGFSVYPTFQDFKKDNKVFVQVK